MTFLYKSG